MDWRKDDIKRQQWVEDITPVSAHELTEVHLFRLSQRITSQSDVTEISKHLGIDYDRVQSALLTTDPDRAKPPQEAAFSLLRDWCSDQPSGQEAYRLLNACLQEIGWNQYATELQLWVQGCTPVTAQQLTPAHIFQVAQRVINHQELRKLQESLSFTHLADPSRQIKTVPEEAYELLRNWRRTQTTGQEAYLALRVVLQKAKLSKVTPG